MFRRGRSHRTAHHGDMSRRFYNTSVEPRRHGTQHNHPPIYSQNSNGRWHWEYGDRSPRSYPDDMFEQPALPSESRRRSPRRRTPGPADLPRSSRAGSFKKAAHSLFNALRELRDYFYINEREFREETALLSRWASEHVVDSLWSIKMDWDGVQVANRERNRHMDHRERQESFRKLATDLWRAWRELRSCQRVPYEALEVTDSRLNEVDVNTTLRELQVAFQAIGDHIRTVRTDRRKVRALCAQLSDAIDSMHDLGPLWKPQPEYRGGHREGHRAAGEGWGEEYRPAEYH